MSLPLAMGPLEGYAFEPGPPEQRERSPRAALLQLLVFLRDADRDGARRLLGFRVPDLEVGAHPNPLALVVAWRIMATFAELEQDGWPEALDAAWSVFLATLDQRLLELEQQRLDDEAEPEPLVQPTPEQLAVLDQVLGEGVGKPCAYCAQLIEPHEGWTSWAHPSGPQAYAHLRCAKVALDEPGLVNARASAEQPAPPPPGDSPVKVDAERARKLLATSQARTPYRAKHKGDDPACELCLGPIHKGDLVRKKAPGSSKSMHEGCRQAAETANRYQQETAT